MCEWGWEVGRLEFLREGEKQKPSSTTLDIHPACCAHVLEDIQGTQMCIEVWHFLQLVVTSA